MTKSMLVWKLKCGKKKKDKKSTKHWNGSGLQLRADEDLIKFSKGSILEKIILVGAVD